MGAFQNRVAVITGGSSGIGRATALAFARAGAKVVIAARGAERAQEVVREIEAAGGQCTYVPTDLANSDQIRHLMEQTVAVYGRLDYAFNNAAGVEALMVATADVTEDQFDRAMATNFKAVWLGVKYQIQQMLKQDPPGGAIVNTSSLNGLGGARLASIYSASKAAILALTKTAAQEYAQQGIRVNALVAGAFDTPMLRGVIDRLAQGEVDKHEAVMAQYRQMIPMGRIGDPAEAAETVLWLCSPAASYVTGHSMIVDGGWSSPLR